MVYLYVACTQTATQKAAKYVKVRTETKTKKFYFDLQMRGFYWFGEAFLYRQCHHLDFCFRVEWGKTSTRKWCWLIKAEFFSSFISPDAKAVCFLGTLLGGGFTLLPLSPELLHRSRAMHPHPSCWRRAGLVRWVAWLQPPVLHQGCWGQDKARGSALCPLVGWWHSTKVASEQPQLRKGTQQRRMCSSCKHTKGAPPPVASGREVFEPQKKICQMSAGRNCHAELGSPFKAKQTKVMQL